MADPEFQLAKRAYLQSRDFFFFMTWSVLLSVTVLLGVLNYFLPNIPGVVFTLPLLAGIGLIGAPFVIIGAQKTWKSLSQWRRAFLKFSLTVNLETIPIEGESVEDGLLQAIISSNPDYEEIMNVEWEDKVKEESKLFREIPELMEAFKNVTIERRGRSATFDLLIGKSAFGEKSKKPASELRKEFQDIETTVARIIKVEPTIDDYRKFSGDVKLLLSPSGMFLGGESEEVGRALLIFSQNPSDQVVKYAQTKNNWPRRRLWSRRVPIDLATMDENGYRVVWLN